VENPIGITLRETSYKSDAGCDAQLTCQSSEVRHDNDTRLLCLHSGFYCSKDDGGDGDNWSYIVQRFSQIVTHRHPNNTQLFTGRMHILSPKQQCQSTEWKSMTLLTPWSPGSVTTTCLWLL